MLPYRHFAVSDELVDSIYPLTLRRCYYALNPGSVVGGVLQQDWTTPESGRLTYLKPFLAKPFQNIDPYGPPSLLLIFLASAHL